MQRARNPCGGRNAPTGFCAHMKTCSCHIITNIRERSMHFKTLLEQCPICLHWLFIVYWTYLLKSAKWGQSASHSCSFIAALYCMLQVHKRGVKPHKCTSLKIDRYVLKQKYLDCSFKSDYRTLKTQNEFGQQKIKPYWRKEK